MTPLSSRGSQGLARRLVLRVLQVLVIMTVAVGIRWIATGEINLVGLQVFATGIGVGIFGACGLVSDELGRRRTSVWSRLGVIAAVFGASVAALVETGAVLSMLLSGAERRRVRLDPEA